MPTTTGHGRNVGSTPTSAASSASRRPRTTRKSTREERDGARRPEGALHAPLDDEGLLHEPVGRAHELEHLDLGAAPLEDARRIVEPTTASTDANTTSASSAAAATPPRTRRASRSVHDW